MKDLNLKFIKLTITKNKFKAKKGNVQFSVDTLTSGMNDTDVNYDTLDEVLVDMFEYLYGNDFKDLNMGKSVKFSTEESSYLVTLLPFFNPDDKCKFYEENLPF